MTLTVRTIAETTARYYGLEYRDVVGPGQRDAAVWVRWVISTLAARHTPQTIADIGRHLGGRNHKTIQNGIDRIEELRVLTTPEGRRAARELREIETAVLTVQAVVIRLDLRPMADIDPYAVAERVLGGPRGATSVTINELQVLANAVLIAAAQLSSNGEDHGEA